MITIDPEIEEGYIALYYYSGVPLQNIPMPETMLVPLPPGVCFCDGSPVRYAFRGLRSCEYYAVKTGRDCPPFAFAHDRVPGCLFLTLPHELKNFVKGLNAVIESVINHPGAMSAHVPTVPEGARIWVPDMEPYDPEEAEPRRGKVLFESGVIKLNIRAMSADEIAAWDEQRAQKAN